MKLHQLYKILEFERTQILTHFQKVDEQHLYYQDTSNAWTPEYLFRHLLMGLRWMSGMLPGDPIPTPEIALLPASTHARKCSLDEINAVFEEISPIIRNRLEELSEEEAEETVQTANFPVVRQVVLTRLITHEYKHLGQITWLLKRSANWTDNEIYKITFDATTWDVLKV
ncbi:MAG: DinB family protein [Candidatus Kariarchaeaceae archaeon]|jgi:uncharacterized damage-inducible protein DinB